MKRRTFLQNIGALAAASALPIPAASKSGIEARVLINSGWVRLTREAATGACAWFTSADGVNWQQSEPLPHILDFRPLEL